MIAIVEASFVVTGVKYGIQIGHRNRLENDTNVPQKDTSNTSTVRAVSDSNKPFRQPSLK